MLFPENFFNTLQLAISENEVPQCNTIPQEIIISHRQILSNPNHAYEFTENDTNHNFIPPEQPAFSEGLSCVDYFLSYHLVRI